MYWTDAQRGVIESSALDGSARAVLIDERRSTLQANNNKSTSVVRPHYYGIALDQRYLYYTDWSRGYVYATIRAVICRAVNEIIIRISSIRVRCPTILTVDIKRIYRWAGYVVTAFCSYLFGKSRIIVKSVEALRVRNRSLLAVCVSVYSVR